MVPGIRGDTQGWKGGGWDKKKNRGLNRSGKIGTALGCESRELSGGVSCP